MLSADGRPGHPGCARQGAELAGRRAVAPACQRFRRAAEHEEEGTSAVIIRAPVARPSGFPGSVRLFGGVGSGRLR